MLILEVYSTSFCCLTSTLPFHPRHLDFTFFSCPQSNQIWKTQQWPQEWKGSVFIPIPKEGNAKESSDYHTIALISHASKVMLKIHQARLQQYVNQELPNVQAGFRKGRRTGDCQHSLDHKENKGSPEEYLLLLH